MKNFKKNWLRYLLQWGVIMLIIAFAFKIFGNETFDPEAYCPFGGLQTFGTYLVQGSMACSMTATQIMMGLVLAVGVVLFSRLFCAYFCPLGTIVESLGKLRAKMGLKEVVIVSESIADKALRAVKYILLFTIFYMTMSESELFCKNFDPYYAFATGFQGELTVWMACISVTICILGSFFIKMFWCKYICPLGAASNIFKFTITFVCIFGAYLLLVLCGIQISWVIPLAVVCIAGYLSEIIYRKSKVFPVMSVCRNDELCNKCGLCTKKCPYSINIASVDKVKCVDCTLCGECISACNKNALSFSGNKNLRWAPAIISLVLFVVAVFLGTTVELPTIDERWGDESKHANLEKLTVEGLRSVKCYGSSKAFSAQVQKIPGAYGVETYVKHSRVNIWYNPAETTPEAIQKAIYVPSKFKINHPSAQDSLIKVITIRTENMHDKMDPNYLGLQFRGSGKKYFGLETEYDCPIIVRLYMGLDEEINEDFLEEMVEMKELVMPVHGGGTRVIEVDYAFVKLEDQVDTITRREFLESQMNAVNRTFKKAVEKYGTENSAVYEMVYPAIDKPIVSRNLPYLISYLSMTEGVLGFKTLLNADEEYALQIIYDKNTLDDAKIWEVLQNPTWTVLMTDGTTQQVEAKMSFQNQGKTL